MTLTLSLKQGPDGAGGTLKLKRGSATIGRGSQNDLVLPDPQRVVSKQHCMIECIDGRYRVTDTSTNGVYLNRGDKPIGRGKHAYLNDGDHLRISHYELQASIAEEAAAQPAAARPPRRSSLSDTHDVPGGREALDRMIGIADRDPGEGPRGPGANPIIPDDSGIFAPARGAAPSAEAGQSAAIEREFFEAPKVVQEKPEEIPEDWLAEEEPAAPPAKSPDPIPAEPIPADPVASAPPAPEPAPAAAPPPKPEVRAPAPPAQAQPGDQAALQAFLDGAGLEDLRIPPEHAAEAMRLLGEMYREVVTGLMEVLATRSSIKNEFRLSQTTIQPAQNNPLKFSLGADDAMAALLTRQGRNYLPPVQAVREAIDDIKAHQVAVLAGMQVALSELLRRFDPATLEERMRQNRSLANLLSVKKARYWDAFGQMYQDLIVEAEDDFHSLFGKEFKRAYEEQVRKLERR